MANEIINQNTNKESDLQDVAKNVLSQIDKQLNSFVAIQIVRSNGKTYDKNGKEKEFPIIKCFMYLPCYDVDNKFIGKFSRRIDVRFTQDAFKTGAFEGCNVSSINDLQTGTLYALARYVQQPQKYQVKPLLDDKGMQKTDKNGKPIFEYPSLWIKGGILANVPFIANQELFNRPEHIDAIEEKIEVAEDEETGEVFEG